MLKTLETYYDAAPRPRATTEEVGPFTLFLRSNPAGFPYYARPRLGEAHEFTAAEVTAVLDRQAELGVPLAIEWVHETSPSLLEPARAAGMTVDECPLLVLDTLKPVPAPAGYTVEMLAADDPRIGAVNSAVHASFGQTDQVGPPNARDFPERISAGILSLAGAFEADGTAVGGGTHGPRGDTTELTGIAVIPRARKQGLGQAVTTALAQDALDQGVTHVFLAAGSIDAASVYQKVGFAAYAIACIGEK